MTYGRVNGFITNGAAMREPGSFTEDSRLADPKKDLSELLERLPRFFSSGSYYTARPTTLNRLLKLLEHFQEWPQLLDSRLSALSSLMIDKLVDCISPKTSSNYDLEEVVAIRKGLCRLLYALCKVRGWRVISNFFPNEPQYLELIVDFFLAEDSKPVEEFTWAERYVLLASFTWEERYVFLLWMSHMMLTPFDLTSMASSTGTPIAERVQSAAYSCIGSSGKERDAAAILLARLVLRPDIRGSRLLEGSISQIVAEFRGSNGLIDLYRFIGRLAYLSQVLIGLDPTDSREILETVFPLVLRICNGNTTTDQFVNASAVSRKIIVKTVRGCTMLILHESFAPTEFSEILLDNAVNHCLIALGDQDTSVRYAASKAISAITSRLNEDMAAEIVEAILENLKEDVRWEKPNSWPDGRTKEGFEDLPEVADLTFVSALRWHGLILALAQLLFKRSVQPRMLSEIVRYLVIALSFQQRAPTGALIGTIVRDVACFGIWSLSRKYATDELLSVKLNHQAPRQRPYSIIQNLASEIIVTATFDPVANIRRGASGALQELIGRHPDCVEEGINLVQCVDYTEVGLRARAIHQVAGKVVALAPQYAEIIFISGILSWRGVAATDADSRREAATFAGQISSIYRESCQTVSHNQRPKWKSSLQVLQALRIHFEGIRGGDLEQRHGTLLAIGSILKQRTAEQSQDTESFDIDLILSSFPKKFVDSQPRQDLTAEAYSKFIEAAFGSSDITVSDTSVRFIIDTILPFVIAREDSIVVTAAAAAFYAVFVSLSSSLQTELISNLRADPPTRAHPRLGVIAALAKLSTFGDEYSDPDPLVIEYLCKAAIPPSPIEARVAAFEALAEFLRARGLNTGGYDSTLAAGLNDYTLTPRGDEGSLVRLAAISATSNVLFMTLDIFGPLLRLSAEKLDKLRPAAYQIIKNHERDESFPPVPSDPVEYFSALLSMYAKERYVGPLLLGLSTSLTAGTASTIRSSRSALLSHLSTISTPSQLLILETLITLLKENPSSTRHTNPLLQMVSLVLDTGLLTLETLQSFKKWRSLYVTVAASHFKVRVAARVIAAVEVYAALVRVVPNRTLAAEVRGRLVGMLGHGLKSVRGEVAGAIWGLGLEEEKGRRMLEETDWAAEQGAALKEKIEVVKLALDDLK